jgi:beta-glucosidase
VCIQEGKAASLMPAYNRTNGEACAASPTLLEEILRRKWGFEGYVVSDCGAIDDIFRHHKLANTPAEAAAMAVRHGCDLNCGDTYLALTEAVQQGLIEEAEIDRAVRRLFEARFRLGMYDPEEMVPYAQIPISVNDCEAHRELARQAARESIVLLKNENRLLPFGESIRSLAVIGPNADDIEALLGNYNGTPSHAVTHLEGIRKRAESAGVTVRYAKGCDLTDTSREGFAQALEAARLSDAVVMVMGIAPKLEGEEGESSYNRSGDRADIGLPGAQEALIQAVYALGKPVVLVLLSGSALAVEWAAQHVPAILAVWYGGEEAGTALAEVLWGDYNPSGRLPVTFYRSLDQVPPFEDYRMEGRTYRFLREEPLYRFGDGLSYTQFAYSGLKLTPQRLSPGESLQVQVTVANTGERAGDEVVQLYLRDVEASVPVPIRHLEGFRRVHLEPGESQTVTFGLEPARMVCWTNDGRSIIEPGVFEVSAGGGQPVDGVAFVTGSFEVVGETMEMED